MADRDEEARLRDLKKRVEREPRSRSFVQLAEEYRTAGRLPEAIRVLEDGLGIHPAYVAARVALARALLEAGRIDESMAAFSKVLADDPSNLVAAKALGDIHLSRGERTEALKRYLRFRAVSGDRRLDDVIARLREEAGPSPDAAPPPPPLAPAPVESADLLAAPPLLVSPLPPIELWPAPPTRRETDPFDIPSVPYAPPREPLPAESAPAEPMLSRDVRLDGIPSGAGSEGSEIVSRKIRLPESAWPFDSASGAPGDAASGEPREAAPAAEVAPPAESAIPEPGGRALAELYLEQRHFAEARRLSEELLEASPGDEGLMRVRDEAAGQLTSAVLPPTADAGRERRLAIVRILNQWLDTIQARGRP